ncbi:MAG: hypothetical protein ACLFNU_00790, partial [Bacteroidales bacterium]
MKSKIVVFIFLLILSAKGISYSQNWEWSNHISGTGSAITTAVATDNSGSFLHALQINGDVTIVGTSPQVDLTSSANSSILIKYDSSGNYLWHIQIGQLDPNNLKYIVVDEDDNIYISGGFVSNSEACTFGSTDENNVDLNGSGQDTYIAKYDPDGILQWAKNVATTSALCRAEGIALDRNNNIIINGFFRGGIGTELDFGNGNILTYNDHGSGNNRGNGFTAMFDNNGNFTWATHFSGDDLVRGFAIQPCQIEGSFALFSIAGSFVIEDTDPLISLPSEQLRWALVKLDDFGNPLWLRTVSTPNETTITSQSLTCDQAGNLLLAGDFSSTTSFTNSDGLDEISLVSNGSFDLFLAKYSKDGDILWAKGAGSPSLDRSIGVTSNNYQHSIYGVYSNEFEVEYDTIPEFDLTYRTLNLNFDASGSLLSSISLGPVGSEDRNGGISLDENGNSIIAGFFESATVDIGTTTYTNGGFKDAFIAKHVNINVLPSITPLLCHDGSDGEISFEISGGGEEPYSYTFRRVGEDEEIIDQGTYSQPLNYQNLTGSIYAIDIEDNAGRAITKYYDVSGPDPITISENITHVTGCYGNQNGEIVLMVEGGAENYTFLWESEDGYGLTPTTQDQNALTAGNYTVTVTDDNGCIANEAFQVNQPDKIVFEGSVVTNNTDNNPDTPNGAINLEVLNAEIPISSYGWTGPNDFTSSDEDISSLMGGTYNVSVTDANSCTADTSFHLVDENLFYIWISDKSDPKCRGGSDGTATVSWDNEETTDGILVEWSDGQTTATATNLAAGTYIATVTNDNSTPDTADDFEVTVSVVIDEPAYPFTLSHTTYPATCPSDNDGAIVLHVDGWSSPYTYDWSTEDGSGLVNGDKNQEDLTVGSYSVIATDDNGCVRTRNISVGSNYAEPDILLDATPSSSLCEGISVDFNASGGSHYIFYVNDEPQGDFSTENTLAI